MPTKRSTIALLACTLISGTASATFTGAYDVSNWTQAPNGGLIDSSGAPGSITLISRDDGSFASADTDFTITAAADGIVSFDWAYSTADFLGSDWDPFGWLLNGFFVQLSVDSSFDPQNGSTSFNVNAGDVFGFRISTADSFGGAASATIRNFNAPLPMGVPEPASLALLGIGLVALGALRRPMRG